MPKDTTQEQFAKLVGITQPAVSQLMRKGVLTRGGSIGQWLQEYVRNLREQAAQFKSDDGIDRIKEAALLDRKKREKIEIEIAEKKNQLLHEDILVDGVTSTFSAVNAGLLAIPTKYQMRCQHLSPVDIETLKTLIRDVCSELTTDRFPARIRARLEKKFNRSETTESDDSEPMGGRKKKVKLGK